MRVRAPSSTLKSSKHCWTFSLAPVAQLDRASDFESAGYRFEPCQVHEKTGGHTASGFCLPTWCNLFGIEPLQAYVVDTTAGGELELTAVWTPTVYNIEYEVFDFLQLLQLLFSSEEE